MASTLQLLAVSAIIIAFHTANGQMIRQCQCSEIEGCKNGYVNSVIPCADACQHHAADMGANYPQLKQCILAQEPKIRATFQCTENRHSNACARGPGGTVPKRYPETLKIAALSEINRMLTRSGIQSEARGLLNAGKKFYGCMKSCLDKRSGNCSKRLGCGLSLPSDNVLVQNAKQCAIQSGFSTPAVQQMCNCAAAAGVRGLGNICNRIIIS